MSEKEPPPLHYLYFYLTEGCNLRCRHCWIDPKYTTPNKPTSHLSFDTFSRIIEEAIPLGLRGVKLTGGEPLLHPEFPRFLLFLREKGMELTVETNGTLLTEEIAWILADFPQLTVSVSLDGARKETNDLIRGIEGAFTLALKGIEILVSKNIRPQIICTVMKWNLGEIPELITLARNLGASSVKINCLQPIARGEQLYKCGLGISVEEILSLSEKVDEVSSSSDINAYIHLPPAFRPLSRLFGEKGDGCSTCGILGILGVLADGSYALCGIGETVEEMVFGRAGQDALACLWADNEVLDNLRRGLPHHLEGICSRCALKGICLGGCIAQNVYRMGNLWAPFWFCEEAEKKGLFPPTRLVRETTP